MLSPMTATFNETLKTFALTSDDIANTMIVVGNPYNHNRAKRFPSEAEARSKFAEHGYSEVGTENPLDTYIATWTENEVQTTRNVAAALKITVPAAYKLLCDATKREIVCKYGYRVKGGWDSPECTNRKCDSLGWQKI